MDLNFGMLCFKILLMCCFVFFEFDFDGRPGGLLCQNRNNIQFSVAFLHLQKRPEEIHSQLVPGFSVFPVANFGTFLKITGKLPLHCTLESFLSLRF